MGIQAPVEDFAAAVDFKTFQDGPGYFHEGLSLQECIVPVVVVRVTRPQVTSGGEQILLNYRSDRFTSSVIGLKVRLTALLTDQFSVRLEAFDGPGAKARDVGHAGECDARDPATGEILLQANIDTQVPLVIDPDFHGPSIEVRVVDPRSDAVFARLTLRNARLD